MTTKMTMPKFIMGPAETEGCQRAAGPDLYYALKRLLTECGEGGHRGCAIDLVSRDAIELAEHDLRKAEGETHAGTVALLVDLQCGPELNR